MVPMIADSHGLMATPTAVLTRGRETCTTKQVCPLYTALRKMSVDLVQKALTEDSEIAQMPLMDHGWEPPLCAAIRFDCSYEVVQMLLEHKSDANQCDAKGRSPFHVLFEKDQGAKQTRSHELSQLAVGFPSRSSETSKGPFNIGSIFSSNRAVPNCQQALLGFTCENLQPTWMGGFSCGQIHASKQNCRLKVAALLLRNGSKYRASATTASCMTEHTNDVHDSKLMRLLHDWPDIATFGLLLCTLKKHQHSHTAGDSLLILCKVHRATWEHVMGYMICPVTWSISGLRFIGI